MSRVAGLLLVLTGMVGVACDGGERPLLVSAASSLAGPFEEIGDRFEAENPGVDVVFNFAGSSTLREQILEGAPADVYASANRSNMEQVAASGLVAAPPRTFARNEIVIGIPEANPAGVAGLDDLARPELLVGLCTPTVPCGELAAEALERASVEVRPDTLEPDARALVTRLQAGELDAGLIYASDAAAVDGVAGIALGAFTTATDYQIAPLTGGSDAFLAERFVAFVLSDEGRAVLASHGFTLA